MGDAQGAQLQQLAQSLVIWQNLRQDVAPRYSRLSTNKESSCEVAPALAALQSISVDVSARESLDTKLWGLLQHINQIKI